MTKKCIKCNVVKPYEDFYKSKKHKDGYMNVCKECHKKRTNTHRHHNKWLRIAYQRKRELIDSLKTPCVKCGDDRDWVIDFHHLNPNEKEFTISQCVGKDIEKIRSEYKKCVCLCSNCHKEFHYFFGSKPTEPEKAFRDFMDENY